MDRKGPREKHREPSGRTVRHPDRRQSCCRRVEFEPNANASRADAGNYVEFSGSLPDQPKIEYAHDQLRIADIWQLVEVKLNRVSVPGATGSDPGIEGNNGVRVDINVALPRRNLGLGMDTLARPGSENLEWWPPHVQKAFRALGTVLGSAQLKPEDLKLVDGEVLPGHLLSFDHASGKQFGKRKGMYSLSICGPAYEGVWNFTSGHLEHLARAAAKR